MSALEGFSPVDLSLVNGNGRNRGFRCPSRELFEAFLKSGHDAMSKSMSDDDLRREAYNLRNYRKVHFDEFGGVGVSTRNGQLTLFKISD